MEKIAQKNEKGAIGVHNQVCNVFIFSHQNSHLIF